MPVRIFAEVLGNCTGEGSEADGSPQRGQASPNLFRVQTEQNDEEKVNPVSARAGMSISPCPRTRAVLVLGPQGSFSRTPSAPGASGPQARAESHHWRSRARTLQREACTFSASTITELILRLNLPLHMPVYPIILVYGGAFSVQP